MDTCQQSFQLGILPERKIDRRAVATGYGLIVLLMLTVIHVGLLYPDRIQLREYRVTSLIPLPAMRPETAPIKVMSVQMKAKLLPPAPVFEQPKLVVPHEIRRALAEQPEAPRVVINQFATLQLRMTAGGARPQLLHTGDFSGSSVAPTVNAAAQKVQTGGFGDPNGLQGTGKQNAQLHEAQTGAFELLAGAGQGNGSGGTKGIQGKIASAGFGNGIANGGNGDGRGSGHGGGISTGGFGSEQVVHSAPKPAQADAGPATNSVEITFKPQPIYTDEARSLKLEGEVLLEVGFAANGTLQVNRVVKGLGHGLDEAAIAAASKMRYKPALRNGQPVDSTAVVHVTFQLAY
jgi:TonB family protein